MDIAIVHIYSIHMYIYIQYYIYIYYTHFLRIIIHSLIELDYGNILTGKPDQFHGKNPWVSGSNFPNKTNPVIVMAQDVHTVLYIYILYPFFEDHP